MIDSNEILSDGKVVKLTPKEKGVLLLLYSNKGRTVLRSQILETVWGDALGNDSGLTQAISKLRHILNDDPREPKLIKTIPKMGYQLMVDSNTDANTEEKRLRRYPAFKNLSLIKKMEIGIILILILVIVILLLFNIQIRIEQLPAVTVF